MRAFAKTYPSAAACDEAERRCRFLAASDVQTPPILERRDRTLCFETISGDTGPALLPALDEMLAALARLHAAPVPAGIRPFDPALWIRPRLRACEHLPEVPLPDGKAGLIHGDFHPRQALRDGRGIWLIDFDDLATGPVEADLANLAAHLATAPYARLDDFRIGIRYWAAQVTEAYPDPVREDRLAGYMLLALVRRSLKLRERGDNYGRAFLKDHLRGSPNFSIL